MQINVITPGKVVPYKCCLPSSSISMKKDFDTDELTLSVAFIEHGQNVNKHDIS